MSNQKYVLLQSQDATNNIRYKHGVFLLSLTYLLRFSESIEKEELCSCRVFTQFHVFRLLSMRKQERRKAQTDRFQ